VRQEQISGNLTRLVLGGPQLAGFVSTGIPDEWVGLVIPGQFQSRYYTIRSFAEELVLDVALHQSGLVSDWVQKDNQGGMVGITEPQGAYKPPDDAQWVVAIADITGMPALARIAETESRPLHLVAECAEIIPHYLSETTRWVPPSLSGESKLAEVVKSFTWPDGPGYFWFAGESGQMRQVRRYLLRDLGWPNLRFHTMGYWRSVATHQIPSRTSTLARERRE
jgi:NADPH-dependent ferric siderophore reductase